MVDIAGLFTIIGGLVGGFALLVTLLTIVFKAGQWNQSRKETTERLENAHETLHRDIAEIKGHVNGETVSHIENCEICGRNDGDE